MSHDLYLFAERFLNPFLHQLVFLALLVIQHKHLVYDSNILIYHLPQYVPPFRVLHVKQLSKCFLANLIQVYFGQLHFLTLLIFIQVISVK